MDYQKSLIILKPDAIQRRVAGTILSRFESAGFKIHAIRFCSVAPEQSKAHYAEHVEKPFYPDLETYITSGPVVVLVLGGLGAIPKIRLMVGATTPAEAAPGTIRGDLAHQPLVKKPGSSLQNLIHASANEEDAAREIDVWFSADEVVDYPGIDDHIHGV